MHQEPTDESIRVNLLQEESIPNEALNQVIARFEEVGNWNALELVLRFQDSYTSSKSSFTPSEIIHIVRLSINGTNRQEINRSLNTKNNGRPDRDELTTIMVRSCKKAAVRAIQILCASNENLAKEMKLNPRLGKHDLDICARFTFFPMLIELVHENPYIMELFSRNPHYALIIETIARGESIAALISKSVPDHVLQIKHVSSDFLARFTRGQDTRNDETTRIGRRLARAILFSSYLSNEYGHPTLLDLQRRTVDINKEIISHLVFFESQKVLLFEHADFGQRLHQFITCLPIFEAVLRGYSETGDPYQVNSQVKLLAYYEKTGLSLRVFHRIIEATAMGEDLTQLAGEIAPKTCYANSSVLSYLKSALRFLENVFLLPYEDASSSLIEQISRARSKDMLEIATFLTSRINEISKPGTQEVEL